jgi:acyl carrier protein
MSSLTQLRPVAALESPEAVSPVADTHLAPDVATVEERCLAQLIVTTLNLETTSGEVNPTAPLYGEGLGLDSIDILELALAISKSYGFQLRSDDGDNRTTFSSLRSLSQHVQQHRTK